MSTASQRQIVAAYFDKQSDAENAIRDLQTAGFRSDQIGSSYEDYDQQTQDFDQLGNVGTTGNRRDLTSDEYSPNSATSSVSAHNESFWDKVKDFFSGETADSDINDHTTTNRAHADVSDRAYSGGWNGGMLVPDQYRDRIHNGGGLVTVHAEGRLDDAEQILRRNHGEIDQQFSSSYGESYGSGAYANSSTGDLAAGTGQGTRADITGGTLTSDYNTWGGSETAVPSANAAAGNIGSTRDRENLDADERRIQLLSEVLRVRKERVERGEVRLRKQVRTETQNIQVPVTREEIVIERTPVEGERTATGPIGTEKEIRVPLSEERVEVEKVPVVTEEVKVGKRKVSNTQNVTDQVRREELDVEGADQNVSKKSDPNRKIA